MGEPMKAKAAVFYGKHDIRVEKIEIGDLKSDEVLIDVRACGVCGTDMHIYDGASGATECNAPVVLGHELAGEVIKVGYGVTSVKIGDRVTVDPNIMCGKCDYCRSGKKHFCKSMIATGVNLNGGFAEKCIVKEEQVYVTSNSVSYEEAAMCEPIGCCLHGIDLADIETGDTVMIIGGGAIGLIMMQLAKLAGATTVIVSEPIENKRKLALKLGADITVDPLSDDVIDVLAKNRVGTINKVIECVGLKQTMLDAIRFVSKGGTVVLFGLTNPECEIPVKPFQLFKREVTIKASFVNPYTHGRAVKILESGCINVKDLIADRYSLDELQQALESHGKNGKMMVTF